MNTTAKPYAGFPLAPHRNGQWFRSIKLPSGKYKQFYFGRLDQGWQSALADYNARLPGILVGNDHLRGEGAVAGSVTLTDLRLRFLEQCKVDVASGGLSEETLGGYLYETGNLLAALGGQTPVAALLPEHFTAYHNDKLVGERKLRAKARKRAIAYVKRMFRWGHGNITGCPLPPFGDGFKGPSTTPEALSLEKARLELPDYSSRIASGEEITKLLKVAQPNFKAMILVAVNCGLGPADIGRLRWHHLDLETGRFSYRRGKTGVQRVGYLWQETRKALLRARETRHAKAAFEKEGQEARVFVTRKRQPYYWVERKKTADGKLAPPVIHNSISGTFGRLVDRAVLAPGLTFYRLRHTFKTLGKKAKDIDALNLMMGHRERTTGKTYDHEDISFKRVRRVAKIIRRRLWPKPKEASPSQPMLRIVGGEAEAA